MNWGSVRAGPHFIVLLVANAFEDTHEIGHSYYIFVIKLLMCVEPFLI